MAAAIGQFTKYRFLRVPPVRQAMFNDLYFYVNIWVLLLLQLSPLSFTFQLLSEISSLLYLSRLITFTLWSTATFKTSYMLTQIWKLLRATLETSYVLTLRFESYYVLYIPGGSGAHRILNYSLWKYSICCAPKSVSFHRCLDTGYISSLVSWQFLPHILWFSNTELLIICWMLFLTSDFAHGVISAWNTFHPFLLY